MSRSLLVVGAGLAGLFAAVLAARRGAAVRLVAEGRGGLALSHGCVDVWRDGDVRFALGGLDRDHPLRIAGRDALEASFTAFLDLMRSARLPFSGSLERSWRLPTALGSAHMTAAAPVSMTAGSLDEGTTFHLGSPAGLRDFSAALAASGLRSLGVDVRGTIDLPLPGAVSQRDLNPTEFALALEREAYRHETIQMWKPRMASVRRLGLPAVLGRDKSLEVFVALEQELGVELFEIPMLPPSLPGQRIELVLRRLAVEAGVDLIEGPAVRGEIDGRSAGRLVSGVVAATAGGPRAYRSEAVLLATGGPLHGGWLSFANGEVQESAFGLPVETSGDRDEWVASTIFEEQPFARFGLRVDSRFRPCDRRNRPHFENLFAAGGLLAGADRVLEGSRQAIDLATAYAAVESALS